MSPHASRHSTVSREARGELGALAGQLLCRECCTTVRGTEARFGGPTILCLVCEEALAPCPERNCGGLLMETTTGPSAGDWQCQACGRTCGRGEVPGPNVIQFPDPGVQSGP